MDLLRVNRETFVPEGNVIGGYNNLIWTERYLEPGEFELKTSRIAETQKLLPEMAFVTLRDTREVMFVETHLIEKDANGKARTLTVKGRTLDAFLEHRALEGKVSGKKYRMNLRFTPAETAGLLIWNAFVNPRDEDITIHPVRGGTRDILDTIPGVAVSDSTTTTPTKKRRWLTGGQVHTPVLEVLKAGGLGLRTVRPPHLGTRQVMTWREGSDTGIVRVERTDEQRLMFDIYNGTDRRQNKANPLVFTTALNHLTDDSYLKSVGLYKTMILMVPGELDARRYYRDRASDQALSGWDRRVLWVDGGQPDKDDDITKAEFREDLRDLADLKLKETQRVKLLEAKVSDNAPYKYNQHYFLGDKLTFLGDYGFKEDMQIVEYVRTYDGKTATGYPGLALIE